MEREQISLASLIGVSLKSIAAGVYDAVRGLLGLSPHYMRVFGRPGEVAAFTDPDSDERLQFFTESGPTWRNEFAPRFLFGTPKYRKGTAERVRMPLLVCVAELDTEADPELAREIAKDAPRGELKTYPVGHFDAYVPPTVLDMVTDQLEFLGRALSIPTEGRSSEHPAPSAG
jgi:pimeloyl-ACP methyl ester carboxylesterase